MVQPGSDNRWKIFSSEGAFKDADDPRLSEIISILIKDTLPGRFERAFPDDDPLLSQSRRLAISEYKDFLKSEMGPEALANLTGIMQRHTKPEHSVEFGKVRSNVSEAGLEILAFEVRASEVGDDISDEALELGPEDPEAPYPLRHYPIIPDLTSFLEPEFASRKAFKKLEPEIICDGGNIQLLATLNEQERSIELKRGVSVRMDARALKELLENAHWHIENEVADKPNHYFSFMRTLLEGKLLDRLMEPAKKYCESEFGDSELTARVLADFRIYLKESGHTSIREIHFTPASGDEATGVYEVELLVAAPKLSEADVASWMRGEPKKSQVRSGLSVSNHIFAVGLDEFGCPIVRHLFSLPNHVTSGESAA